MAELVRMASFGSTIFVRTDLLLRGYHGQEKGYRSDLNLQRCNLMEGHRFVRSWNRKFIYYPIVAVRFRHRTYMTVIIKTWDWHIGWTMYRIGFTSMIQMENFGWWIEFTPAFFGAGQFSLSFFRSFL